jgi:hypothetical protein
MAGEILKGENNIPSHHSSALANSPAWDLFCARDNHQSQTSRARLKPQSFARHNDAGQG